MRMTVPMTTLRRLTCNLTPYANVPFGTNVVVAHLNTGHDTASKRSYHKNLFEISNVTLHSLEVIELFLQVRINWSANEIAPQQGGQKTLISSQLLCLIYQEPDNSELE